jgi:circadian clock protein KaiC
MQRDLARTGIKGLDVILNGGVPRGHVVVVTGGPGTGKTTLGLEFVYRGAREFGEPGLIITFEVSAERIIADAETLGWDFRELEEQGRLKVVSTTRSVLRQEVQQPDSLLLSEAAEMGAQRIFIDGLAGIALNGNGNGNAHPRDAFHLLIDGLHRQNLIAVFALDAPADRAAVGDVSEEFVADTIIRLARERRGRNTVRSIEVVKSRSHDYLDGAHSFSIVSGKGLEVYRRVQMPRSAARERAGVTDLLTRVPTGIGGLDELLNGGYFRGSTTAVVGISGTGKSVMGLQFLMEGARRGERGLMVTLDEPVVQVIRNATTLGIDLQAEIDRDMLHVWYEPPQEIMFDRHFAAVEDLVETVKPQRVLIDSLSSYGGSIGSIEEFRDLFHAFIALMRERQITAVYNFENPEMLGMSSMMGEFRVSSLVDNIILMNWVELGDKFRHALTVAKARAMPTNRTTHECEIVNGRGMTVLPREVRVAVPTIPFAGYYSLLSRAPERRPPQRPLEPT